MTGNIGSLKSQGGQTCLLICTLHGLEKSMENLIVLNAKQKINTLKFFKYIWCTKR